MIEKAEFIEINEHFEIIFNAAEATQIVFQSLLIVRHFNLRHSLRIQILQPQFGR